MYDLAIVLAIQDWFLCPQVLGRQPPPELFGSSSQEHVIIINTIHASQGLHAIQHPYDTFNDDRPDRCRPIVGSIRVPDWAFEKFLPLPCTLVIDPTASGELRRTTI